MTKAAKIKTALAGIMIIILLSFTVFVLFSCSPIDETNTNQTEGVDEPDIVKMTDDGFIIKLQPDGMTATKVENGILTLSKKKASEDYVKPVDLIAYDKYMISIVTYGDVYTLVSYYDMEDMNDGTDRLEAVRETMFFGKYFTSRIYEGAMYMLAQSGSVYYKYNSETNKVESTGVQDSIRDSVQGAVYYNELAQKDGRQGFLMSRLDLTDIAGSSYTLSSYLSANLSDLYFSQHAMHLIFNKMKSKGCANYKMDFSITSVSLDTLQIKASSDDYEGYITSRYCLYDNGENLFVVSSFNSTDLRVFDSKLDIVSAKIGIFPGSFKTASFESAFCYILTYRDNNPLLKINISNPASPTIVGYIKYSDSSVLTYNYADGFTITAGKSFESTPGENSGYAYTQYLEFAYYDMTDAMPYHINTVKIDASFTPAMSNKKSVFMSQEDNFFGFCSEKGAHILRVDEYGYLELAATLPKDGLSITNGLNDIAGWNWGRVKLFDGYIYAIYADEIISYSLSDFTQTDSLSTVLKTDELPL